MPKLWGGLLPSKSGWSHVPLYLEGPFPTLSLSTLILPPTSNSDVSCPLSIPPGELCTYTLTLALLILSLYLLRLACCTVGSSRTQLVLS